MTASVSQQPGLLAMLSTAGIDSVGGSAADYPRAIAGENERLANTVAQVGLKPE